MKNDEIRDRLATLKESVGLYKIAGRHTSANRLDEACGIIETLLARQDEHEAEIARLTTILYGKPIAAPEISEVAVGPLMSVPQFFGMLNELRNSAQLTEATASAKLAKETKND